MLKVYISMRIAPGKNRVLNRSGPSLTNFFETLKKGVLTWIAWMKKVEELKDLGALLGVDFMIWLGVNQCFAPLPCTVYLVLKMLVALKKHRNA